ncbi:hypothetical protein [Streptomyces sp. NPDC058953]|uniref:hypothetical protein n=1 Tax=unclassified Streptomyces TaxID=2593676 RepID=UPI0036B240B2
MSVTTILPFGIVLVLCCLFVQHGRDVRARVRRAQTFLESLPPRSTPPERTDRLALEALDHLCGKSGSVPDVFVDLTRYFADRSWNSADIHHIMGRLTGLGFAHQVVGPRHPINEYRYRATEAGVRENMANVGRREATPGFTINQTSGSGPNTATVNSPGARTNVHHHQSQEVRFSYGELSRLLREEAARAPQGVADTALSHADALDAAVADGADEPRDQAVGRIHRFLLTAGDGFQATQNLLNLLGN